MDGTRRPARTPGRARPAPGVASPHLRRRERSTWSSVRGDVTREAGRGGAERGGQWAADWAGQRRVRGDPGMVSREWCPVNAQPGARSTAESRPRVRSLAAAGPFRPPRQPRGGAGAWAGGGGPSPIPLWRRFLRDPAGVGAWLVAIAMPMQPGQLQLWPGEEQERQPAARALAALGPSGSVPVTCPWSAHMGGRVTLSQLCALREFSRNTAPD